MSDLIVKLYDLDFSYDLPENILIKRPIGPEKIHVLEWTLKNFGKLWASEVDVAFSKNPISVFVAYEKESKDIVGFACYDTTSRGFFGPTGVLKEYRKKGIGKALLLRALQDMMNVGYAYAIIGDAGPVEYYKKAVGAIEIPDSSPGVYKDLLDK
ncbi:GNAT superfamily N-acetyltransferase [Thermosipho japonicus]|uniref:GNAT superfamily N-acetyltransferase n=1 Tax=Thermosipho japonicus TaxID=90323 RepID=A0A841GS18_9BACT|nr:GNAT family N-acetyltransferase [Thermosipho japonicus]MBB6062743.1 GNAT superfamily N-acetyltransferase [Thermosipho japonicus]